MELAFETLFMLSLVRHCTVYVYKYNITLKATKTNDALFSPTYFVIIGALELVNLIHFWFLLFNSSPALRFKYVGRAFMYGAHNLIKTDSPKCQWTSIGSSANTILIYALCRFHWKFCSVALLARRLLVYGRFVCTHNSRMVLIDCGSYLLHISPYFP